MILTQPLDPSWHPKIKHFGLDLMVEKHEYYGTHYEYEMEYNARCKWLNWAIIKSCYLWKKRI
jgi:hypothetical protein